MEREATIRQQFDRSAVAYGQSTIFSQGDDLTLMVQSAEPTSEMSVLDVGCGAGHTGLAFAPYVKEVMGVDLSQGMLVEAERQAAIKGFTNVLFQEANAAALPFSAEQFDIVTCRYVAHHFPSLTPALTEIFRVLKPGGTLFVVDIISPEDPALAKFLDQLERLRDPSHSCDWKISEWQTVGERVGIPLTVISQWQLPLDFADWTTRQQTPPEAIAQLEKLLDDTSSAVQSAFSLVSLPQRSFVLISVLLQGKKLASLNSQKNV